MYSSRPSLIQNVPNQPNPGHAWYGYQYLLDEGVYTDKTLIFFLHENLLNEVKFNEKE